MSAARLRAVLELDLRDFGFVPIAQAHQLAQHIPNANLIELDGADSAPPFGDVGAVLVAVEEFLTGGRHSPDPDRALATVLFTDLVLDGTRGRARRSQVGHVMARHDELLRDQVDRFHGHVWRTIGDGVVATFLMPRDPIKCALSIRDRLTASDPGTDVPLGGLRAYDDPDGSCHTVRA